jgi:hypothetical protein
MNKKAQFKVALKRCLNTHSFYSVKEFHMFKKLIICAEIFFLLFVLWTLYNIRIVYVKLFLCYLYSILKNYLSVVLSYWFCVVFVLLLLHLSVCFVT